MTEDAGSLEDTEPRRRSGLGSSPLSRVMPTPKRFFDDLLAAHDRWAAESGARLREVTRRKAAPVVREPEPEPAVEELAVVDVEPVEATPPPQVRSASQVEEPTTVPAAPLSTSDLLARLKAMGMG